MLKSRSPRRIAIWAFVLPGALALTSEFVIWLIPGCHPNPYSIESCVVLAYGVGKPLMVGLLGGASLAAVLFVFVSLPLSIVSLVRSRRRSSNDVA
jgi:hypothetical protein